MHVEHIFSDSSMRLIVSAHVSPTSIEEPVVTAHPMSSHHTLKTSHGYGSPTEPHLCVIRCKQTRLAEP